MGIASEMLEILTKILTKILKIIFIQVSQLRELIEVKEVILTSPHAQLRELIEVKERFR